MARNELGLTIEGTMTKIDGSFDEWGLKEEGRRKRGEERRHRDSFDPNWRKLAEWKNKTSCARLECPRGRLGWGPQPHARTHRDICEYLTPLPSLDGIL